jgi:hypothetical protein
MHEKILGPGMGSIIRDRRCSRFAHGASQRLLLDVARREHQHGDGGFDVQESALSKKRLNVQARCPVLILRTRAFEEEAKVIGKSSRGLAAHSVIVASVALAFGLAAAPRSFAGSGGYCEAQQARTICHRAVKAQGLQARQRDVEFDKCKADPASYMQPYRLSDDGEMTFE